MLCGVTVLERTFSRHESVTHESICCQSVTHRRNVEHCWFVLEWDCLWQVVKNRVGCSWQRERQWWWERKKGDVVRKTGGGTGYIGGG